MDRTTPVSSCRRGGSVAGDSTETSPSLGAARMVPVGTVAENNAMTRTRSRSRPHFPLIGAMLEAGQRERGVLLAEASKVRGL